MLPINFDVEKIINEEFPGRIVQKEMSGDVEVFSYIPERGLYAEIAVDPTNNKIRIFEVSINMGFIKNAYVNQIYEGSQHEVDAEIFRFMIRNGRRFGGFSRDLMNKGNIAR